MNVVKRKGRGLERGGAEVFEAVFGLDWFCPREAADRAVREAETELENLQPRVLHAINRLSDV